MIGSLLAFGLTVLIPPTGQELRMVPPRYGHQLYLPKKMWATKRKWPLILYLHGKSLRGNDLSQVGSYGLPARLKTDKGFPFIVVAPQLPDGERWTDTKALTALVQEVAGKTPVDRTRMYAVGYSMGASGVWRVAHDRPSLFAAIVSVGGTYEKNLATSGRLKSVPIWVIHGTADTEASPQDAKNVIQLHAKSGGTGFFSALQGRDHNIPDIFDESRIYQWLLKQRRALSKKK